MKRVLYSISLMFAVLCLTMACRTAEDSAISAQYEAIPSRMEREYTVSSDILTKVHVAADVIAPNTGNFPIYEITYKPVSDDVVNAFVDAVSFGKAAAEQAKPADGFSIVYDFDEKQTGRIEVVVDEHAGDRLSFSLEGKYQVLTLPTNPYVTEHDGNTVLTMAEAEEEAKAFAAKVSDYQLIGSGVKRGIIRQQDEAERERLDLYEFIFVPVEENGAFRTYVDTAYLESNTTAAPRSVYRAARKQPSLRVIVNEHGVLRAIWESADAEEVRKKIAENTALLPFDEVMHVFAEQIGQQGNFLVQHGEPPISRTLYITEIRLGYMRTTKADQTDPYRLIPVWDFFGYETNVFASQADTEWKLDENNASTRPALGHSYLTVNALDGSIINRVLGY